MPVGSSVGGVPVGSPVGGIVGSPVGSPVGGIVGSPVGGGLVGLLPQYRAANCPISIDERASSPQPLPNSSLSPLLSSIVG